MSADNWAVCPKCTEEKHKEIEAIENKLHKSYGQVSIEEYANLTNTLLEARKEWQHNTKETLREDYEIGINENEFQVFYGGTCTKCHWSFVFEYIEKVELEKELNNEYGK